MKYILALFLLFSCNDFVCAQSAIRGAELVKQSTTDQELIIRLRVYRQGNSKDTITFDWGDGQVEHIPLGYFHLHSSGNRVDTYIGMHTYNTPGYYEVSYLDSFLVADVVNIQDSNNKYINLKDSVLIFETDHPFSFNYNPEFFSTQFEIDYGENGAITHWAYVLPNDPGTPDEHISKLVPFPAEGYTLAEATDSLYIDQALFVWDRPIAPGTYAFCIQIREMRVDFFDEFPTDSILMSTTHRAMMIDVDSSMLVSSFSPWVKGIISIFPNPAAETISIQLGHFNSDPTISIFDLSGKRMFVQYFPATPSIEQIQVEAGDWPRGLYLIQIETVDGMITRKVFLE